MIANWEEPDVPTSAGALDTACPAVTGPAPARDMAAASARIAASAMIEPRREESPLIAVVLRWDMLSPFGEVNLRSVYQLGHSRVGISRGTSP